MIPDVVTTPVPVPPRVIVLTALFDGALMALAMFSALDDDCVMLLLDPPSKRNALPPRKNGQPPELNVKLFSKNGIPMAWFNGVARMPRFVEPPKNKWVAFALVGAVPPQLPPVLHKTPAPPPFQVNGAADAVCTPVARVTITARRSPEIKRGAQVNARHRRCTPMN